MVPPPVSFTEKAKASANGGGYPVQISAADLDRNFTYATTDFPKYDDGGNEQPWIVTEIVGPSGHTQRQLVLNPAAPSGGSSFFCVQDGTLTWLPAPTSGTHVLGVVNGALQWIDTEEC